MALLLEIFDGDVGVLFYAKLDFYCQTDLIWRWFDEKEEPAMDRIFL
jgi:hypothetical protein